MKIINQTKNVVLAKNARLADTFFSRMVGLLNRASLEKGEGLVITKCKSIHMFFMRFAIDAVFLNKSNVVVGLVESIKPFRLSRVYYSASYVVELPSGVIGQTETTLGDHIDIQY